MKRLSNIFSLQEKTKESRTPSYAYSYDQEEDKSDSEGVLGQFVVQYDVDRPKHGEILVRCFQIYLIRIEILFIQNK